MPTKIKELVALIQADGWHLVQQKGNYRQYHPSKPGTVTVTGKESVEVPPGTLNSVRSAPMLGAPKKSPLT